MSRAAPQSRDYVWGVAMTQSELGHILDGAGAPRRDEASRLLEASGAWYSEAVKATPDDFELLVYHGNDLLRISELLSHRGGDAAPGRAAAIAKAREAVAALSRAGDATEAARDAARAGLFLGDRLLDGGEGDSAAHAWEDARSRFETLAAANPRIPSLVIDLARSEGRLARIAGVRGQPADADRLRERARKHLADARGRTPDDPGLPEALAELDRDPR